MIFQQIKVGKMDNFAYVIADSKTKEAAIVDPGWDADILLDFCSKNGLKVKKILLTHTHYDHINDVNFIFQKTNAEVYIHSLEAETIKKINDIHKNQGFLGHQKSKGFFSEMRIIEFENNDKIEIGNIEIEVMHTPGHSPGSSCFLFCGKIITGDTLFVGSIGRTDLPGGNPKVMSESLRKLRKLNDGIEVYPGHDYGVKKVSTIGWEKENNPYLT